MTPGENLKFKMGHYPQIAGFDPVPVGNFPSLQVFVIDDIERMLWRAENDRHPNHESGAVWSDGVAQFLPISRQEFEKDADEVEVCSYLRIVNNRSAQGTSLAPKVQQQRISATRRDHPTEQETS
jgi:hypothetical protein